MHSSPSLRAPKLQLVVEQHWQEDAGTHLKKNNPHPKTKKNLQQNGRRGTISKNSSPISAWCVTHPLENNNPKEVLSLLWRLWTPGFPPWRFSKGTMNSHRIWPWEPAGFDYRTSWGLAKIKTPASEGTSTILHSPKHRQKCNDSTGDWTKNTC